jgi:hypothetical protein
MGVFQIVALNNPVGIIRSVENTNGVPLWHPDGMHPYGMPTTTGTLLFLPSDSFLRNEQKRQFEIHPFCIIVNFSVAIYGPKAYLAI